MEKFKFLSLALFVALASIGLSSCSDDGSDGPLEPGREKVVKGIVITATDGDVFNFSSFSYDEQHRILGYTVNGDEEQYRYQYGSSYVIREEWSTSESQWVDDNTYQLTNGLITSADGDTYEYTSGNLVKWTEDPKYYMEYIWENGNPVKESIVGWNSVKNYDYSTLLNKIGFMQQLLDSYGYASVEIMGGSFLDPFLMNAGFFGNLPKNLISKIKDSEGGETTLSYDMDSDGYPVKIVAVDDDGDSAIMTISWE